MAQFSKDRWPADGPVRELLSYLETLHCAAGRPSLAEMGRAVVLAPSTLSAFFTGRRLISRGNLELVVEHLDGDPVHAEALRRRAVSAWASLRHSPAAVVGVLSTDPPETRADLRPPVTTLPAPAEQGVLSTGRDRVEDGRLGAARAGNGPVPRQLPADVAGFTGRVEELDRMDTLLSLAGRSTGMVISVLSGTAGVGKTALAVHWAHRVADRFTDGQMYVDLRGYDPDQPMLPEQALSGFLRALSVADEDIPYDTAERAALYRTLLAGRRMLILLDNAHDADQVRWLLPGTSACVVVVTSRDDLPALVARHGACRIDLGPLPDQDAITLLRTIIGKRVDAEPASASMLAEHCDRLPLTLRIAAELAITRRTATLADLVAELADEQRRLDLLDAGCDPRTAVRAVFWWSYRHLAAPAARAFRLLGQHLGRDIDIDAAAALVGIGLDQARRNVDVLLRAHLVHHTSAGRFGMHDLLRAYARNMSLIEDSETHRQAALTRLFDHYLANAAAAAHTLAPAKQHRRPSVAPAVAPLPLVADPPGALNWLRTEQANLVAIITYAAVNGWPSHATRLAATIFRYLHNGAHYQDALAVHTNALNAARHGDDQAVLAQAMTDLACVYWRLGRHNEAVDHLQDALGLSREVDDRIGEVRELGNLGILHWVMGQRMKAIDYLQDALTVSRQAGDQVGEAAMLGHLGAIHERLGHYSLAISQVEQALSLFRQAGDRPGEARVLVSHGVVQKRLGHYSRAIDELGQALTMARTVGDRLGETYALCELGIVHLRLSRYVEAGDHLQQALALSSDIGDRIGEACALANLAIISGRLGHTSQAIDRVQRAVTLATAIGDRDIEVEVFNDAGDALLAAHLPDEARLRYSTALGLAEEIGDQYERARALDGIACTHHSGPSTGEARLYWLRAVCLFADLGVPDADRIRAQLAALDSGEPDIADQLHQFSGSQ